MRTLVEMMSDDFDMRPSYAAAWFEYLSKTGDAPPPTHRKATDMSENIEKVCTDAAMAQWESSLKRSDLSEKDRVRGAVEAYKRQAFAFAVIPPPVEIVMGGKFGHGDRVRKTKGSSWQGRIVGFYSTELTPVGYAVESEREPGSVQIYPESALAALASTEGTEG